MGLRKAAEAAGSWLVVYALAGIAAYVLLTISWPLPPAPTIAQRDDFDGQAAFENVRYLVETYPNRTTGSDADRRAADWIERRFRELGLDVRRQDFAVWGIFFGEAGPGRHRGVNVLGVLPGAVPEAIVVGAHRDVVPATVQGAEDNGSGTGVMLELARELATRPHHYTYVFASWGGEEIGLGGSRWYQRHPVAPTALALSLDMVGQADGTRLSLSDWHAMPLAALAAAHRLGADVGLVEKPLRKPAIALLGTPLGTSDGFGGSDTAPFAANGVPALYVRWAEPPYQFGHTPEDSLDKLSPESLAAVGNYVLSYLDGLERQNLLAGSPWYLVPAPGRYVPPAQVYALMAVLLLFAASQPALTWLRARRLGVDVRREVGRELRCLIPFAVGAAALSAYPLALDLGQAPDLWWAVGWGAIAVAGLIALLATRRRGAATPLGKRLAWQLTLLGAYVAVAALAGPFLAFALLGYHLVILSRVTFLGGWWRLLDILLLLPGIGLVTVAVILVEALAVLAAGTLPGAREYLVAALLWLLLLSTVARLLAPRAAPAAYSRLRND